MTTTLSSKGQLIVPKAVRDKLSLAGGVDFLVLTTITGDILLRPMKRPRKSLLAHLQSMSEAGIRIQPLRDPAPEPLEL